MSISLKVLAPNKNVYQGEAEEVILPSTTGQLGVLPGHISLVTAIDIGVLRLINSFDGGLRWNRIGWSHSFSKQCGNWIRDLKEAKLVISKFSENEKNPEKIKALQEISKAEARIQAAKN